MAKNTQRLSQLVSTFGPGAMLDLPTRSVVVSGLDFWELRGGASQLISEPRLTERLERKLKESNRLSDSATLTLQTPPMGEGETGGLPRGIDAPIFPTWFVCETVEQGSSGKSAFRRRRLVRWQDLDSKNRTRFDFDDGRKSAVTPIRFVCACEKGHLQDIDWRWVVHSGQSCQEPMWLEEKGTSADPSDTSVVCGCGKRLLMQDLFVPNRLGNCRGERPWLLDRDPEGCDKTLKLMTRTATNTYFPQVITVISLPVENDELTQAVAAVEGEMAEVEDLTGVSMSRKYNPRVRDTLAGYTDADILDRLRRLRLGAQVEGAKSPKLAEFDALACGQRFIGQNAADARLFAETVDRSGWCGGDVELDLSAIRGAVAVHRLREVSCLYGFTRFEAAPTSADGDLEELTLAVDGAPLTRDKTWLPAIEQFGEGIFLLFDPEKISDWTSRETTQQRQQDLEAGFEAWARKFGTKAPNYPGTAYYLLHSLSHALMSEIAMDCGYPASSLKERVYAFTGPEGGRFGILIYTATAGAQGTLGGLVGVMPSLGKIIQSALRKAEICSSDPVCSDHEPAAQSGDRAAHGAACHSCLLIPETSCESRNLFLDRSLLVGTMAGKGCELFSRW